MTNFETNGLESLDRFKKDQMYVAFSTITLAPIVYSIVSKHSDKCSKELRRWAKELDHKQAKLPRQKAI